MKKKETNIRIRYPDLIELNSKTRKILVDIPWHAIVYSFEKKVFEFLYVSMVKKKQEKKSGSYICYNNQNMRWCENDSHQYDGHL